MREKFVVRLVDQQYNVLAWAVVHATPKSLSRACCQFWPDEQTKLVITQGGRAVGLAIHWTDYDVAKFAPLPTEVEVAAGMIFDFNWAQPVWVIDGQDIPLHAVTVSRSLEIGPPTGTLNQRTD